MYGKWELESLWRVLGLTHETGDTQFVVFDLENQSAMISYSRSYMSNNKTVVEEAYRRSPFYINLNNMW